jgi:hypothetical protein
MRHPAGRETPHLLQNPKVCFCVNKNRIEQNLFTFYRFFML